MKRKAIMKWRTTKFDGSESANLPLRPKDLVLHFRTQMVSPDRPEILDFWQMKGECELWITNKEEELPPGFELHPKEVCNDLARKMGCKLNSGWAPGEFVQYPTIWRVRAGDRVVIVGERSHLEGGVYHGVFDFGTSALTYWLWPGRQLPSVEDAIAATPAEGDSVCKEWMRQAYARVSSMGVPRTFNENWTLG